MFSLKVLMSICIEKLLCWTNDACLLTKWIQTIERVFVKKALLFPGQGSQFVGMGSDIYHKYKFAKDIYDQADKVLGKGFTKLVFEGSVSELTLTKNAQPGIVITFLRRVILFREWILIPTV